MKIVERADKSVWCRHRSLFYRISSQKFSLLIQYAHKHSRRGGSIVTLWPPGGPSGTDYIHSLPLSPTFTTIDTTIYQIKLQGSDSLISCFRGLSALYLSEQLSISSHAAVGILLGNEESADRFCGAVIPLQLLCKFCQDALSFENLKVSYIP